MELVIILIGFLLALLGIAGSFLPIIPGPLTSWLGLFVTSYSNSITISNSFLTVTFIIALLIFVLDYIIPVVGQNDLEGVGLG